MIRKQHDGKWYFRKWVRLPDGTSKRIFGVPGNFGLPNTKTSTEEALRRTVAKLLDGTNIRAARRSTAPDVAAFADTFMRYSKSQDKLSFYRFKETTFRKHIVPLLGAHSIADINYSVIEEFKYSVAKSVSPKSTNNILSVVRSMLTHAEKHGLISGLPTIEPLRVKKPDFDFLTFDEAKLLLAGARPEGEWYTKILLALRTGMRQGELRGLRWKDVDLKAGKIIVRQAIVCDEVTTPKSNKSREIGLSSDILAALKEHRHLRGELVFCRMDGAPLTKANCRYPLWRSCARAGIRMITWHVLRHTFASHLAMKGTPILHIKELMGHSTIDVTMRYAHLAPGSTRNVVELLCSDAHWMPDTHRTAVE